MKRFIKIIVVITGMLGGFLLIYFSLIFIGAGYGNQGEGKFFTNRILPTTIGITSFWVISVAITFYKKMENVSLAIAWFPLMIFLIMASRR